MAGFFMFGPLAHAAPEPKVTICHVPPGQPDKQLTLTIGASAVAAHLANHPGDSLGECGRGGCARLKCDDNNPCTSDSCLLNPRTGEASCVHLEQNCDDGNFCTTDSCQDVAGVAVCTNQPFPATACEDGNACTVDSCDPASGCVNSPAPDGTACDDGNFCSSPDVCTGGVCSGTPTPNCCTQQSDCIDSDNCSVDTCENNTCVHQPRICPTINACIPQFCNPSNGQCTGTLITCDDGDPCTDDSCATICEGNPPPETCCFNTCNSTIPGCSCPVQ